MISIKISHAITLKHVAILEVVEDGSPTLTTMHLLFRKCLLLRLINNELIEFVLFLFLIFMLYSERLVIERGVFV